MRTCTRCQSQVQYIEEGIEDDELDRYRTSRGRLLHRKRRRARKSVTYVGVPEETDVIAAFQSILVQSADAIQSLHGFPPAFVFVVERLWFRYLHVLSSRLPFSVLHFFLIRARRAAASLPSEFNPDGDMSGAESGDDAAPPWAEVVPVTDSHPPPSSSSSSLGPDRMPVHHKELRRRVDLERAQRQRALKRARSASPVEAVEQDATSELATDLVRPSMPLVLAILLAASRSCSLPLLAADLVRAVRDGIAPYFTAHARIEPDSLRRRLLAAHGSPLAFFRPKDIPAVGDVLVLAECFMVLLQSAVSASAGGVAVSVSGDMGDGEQGKVAPSTDLNGDAGLKPIHVPFALQAISSTLRLPPEAAQIAARFIGPETSTGSTSADPCRRSAELVDPPTRVCLLERVWCEVELGALLVLGCRLCKGWESWEYAWPRFAEDRPESLPWSPGEARWLRRSDLGKYTALSRTALRRTRDITHFRPPDESGIWTEEIAFLEERAALASEKDASNFEERDSLHSVRCASWGHGNAGALNSRIAETVPKAPNSSLLAACAEGTPLPGSGDFGDDIRCLVTYPLAASVNRGYGYASHYHLVDPDESISSIVCGSNFPTKAAKEAIESTRRTLEVGDRVVLHGLPEPFKHFNGSSATILEKGKENIDAASHTKVFEFQDSCAPPVAKGMVRVRVGEISESLSATRLLDLIERYVMLPHEELDHAKAYAKLKIGRVGKVLYAFAAQSAGAKIGALDDPVEMQLKRPFHFHYEALIEVVAQHIGVSPLLLHTMVAALDRRLALQCPIVTIQGKSGIVARVPRHALVSSLTEPSRSDELSGGATDSRCLGCGRKVNQKEGNVARFCFGRRAALCPFKIALDKLTEPGDTRTDIMRKRRLLLVQWRGQDQSPVLGSGAQLSKLSTYSAPAEAIRDRVFEVGHADGLVDPDLSDPWAHLASFGFSGRRVVCRSTTLAKRFWLGYILLASIILGEWSPAHCEEHSFETLLHFMASASGRSHDIDSVEIHVLRLMFEKWCALVHDGDKATGGPAVFDSVTRCLLHASSFIADAGTEMESSFSCPAGHSLKTGIDCHVSGCCGVCKRLSDKTALRRYCCDCSYEVCVGCTTEVCSRNIDASDRSPRLVTLVELVEDLCVALLSCAPPVVFELHGTLQFGERVDVADKPRAWSAEVARAMSPPTDTSGTTRVEVSNHSLRLVERFMMLTGVTFPACRMSDSVQETSNIPIPIFKAAVGADSNSLPDDIYFMDGEESEMPLRQVASLLGWNEISLAPEEPC